MTIIDRYAISGQTFIIEFYAPWCGPCKMYGPKLHHYCEQNKIPLIQIDGDTINETHELYTYVNNLNISAYPTTLIYVKGITLHKVVGADLAKVDKIINGQ